MALSQKQRENLLAELQMGKSLRKACEAADVSSPAVVFRLCDGDREFADQYARARQEGYAMLAEQLLETIDDSATDPARLRIQVDTRKWMLSKMLPKLYGDKLDLNHSGSVSTTDALTIAELQAVVAAGKDHPTE